MTKPADSVAGCLLLVLPETKRRGWLLWGTVWLCLAVGALVVSELV